MEILTLTVNTKGRVYPSKALCRELELYHGQRINLWAPTQRSGGLWHLDVRPITPPATLTLLVAGNYYPQFQSPFPLSPRHFKDPHRKGQTFRLLLLELVSDQPEVDNYYALRPLPALSTPSDSSTSSVVPGVLGAQAAHRLSLAGRSTAATDGLQSL
jgi:hypothetical protein